MLISTRELRVGGLIGQLTEGGTVQESYAVSFSGSTPLTDFVGHPLVSAWSGYEEGVSDSYFGGNQRQDSPMGERRAVKDMKLAATYQGWDFSAAWSLAEGDGYPDLVSNPRSTD